MLVFLPLPGFKILPAAARVLMALALAAVLAASAPPAAFQPLTGPEFLIRLLADLLTGVSIGMVSSLVVEAFNFAA